MRDLIFSLSPGVQQFFLRVASKLLQDEIIQKFVNQWQSWWPDKGSKMAINSPALLQMKAESRWLQFSTYARFCDGREKYFMKSIWRFRKDASVGSIG